MPIQRVVLLVLLFVISAQITLGQEPKASPTAAPEGKDAKSSPNLPPGFQASENPHSGGGTWIGRRNRPRTTEVENKAANVTALKVEREVIYSPCATKSDSECTRDEAKIQITTEAEDKENDVLAYAYTVSAGKIIGQGANVIWDLSGLSAGSYVITAGVNDGCGICGKTITKTVEIKDAPDVESITFDKTSFATWCPAEKFLKSIYDGPCSKADMYVNVKTLAKNGDAGMTYYYVVSGGEIVGSGADVKWVFGEAPPGEYTITVGLGRNNIIPGKTLSRTIVRKACSVCDFGCECANVSASGPEGLVKPGDAIVFRAKVDGGPEGLTYKWLVSAGTIINDPTSFSIMVKVPKEMKAGDIITATFYVEGTRPDCNCPKEVPVTVRILTEKPYPEREL